MNDAASAPRSILAARDYAGVGDINPLAGGMDTAMWRFVTPDGTPHALHLFYLALRRGYGHLTLPDQAPFLAWAGAVLLQEMEPRLGRPGVWVGDRDLDPQRRWTDGWKRQAGLD